MDDRRLIFGLAARHYADFQAIFSRYPQIQKVLIFGSRAKGIARSGSDFDLAVFAPDLSDGDFSRLWNEVDALPVVFKIDLLHWDRLPSSPLKEKIVAEGKLFYPLPEPAS